MPSKAERVCARIAQLLTGATAAGARVYRDRQDAFTRDESPALLVECIEETTAVLGGGTGAANLRALHSADEDTLRVAVTTCVRSAGWQAAADAVRVQAHALLMADAELRALVADLRRDRCEWRAASADQPFGYAAQIYQVKYHTRNRALDDPL